MNLHSYDVDLSQSLSVDVIILLLKIPQLRPLTQIKPNSLWGTERFIKNTNKN